MSLRGIIKAFFLGLFSLAIVSCSQSSEQTKNIKIVSIVDHPSLNVIRQGVLATILNKEKTASHGFHISCEYQSAQGNPALATQIAKQYIGAHPDAIVAITTPAAQAVAAATRSIPLVFAGITDPISAQLIRNWEPSKTNITGVADQLPLDEQINLIKRLLPKATKVGVIYNPSETNSKSVVDRLTELLPKQNMVLTTVTAARTIDVAAAARSLIDRQVDVIFTSTDNTVISAYESLVRVASEKKIPLIASDFDSVKRGALAALGMDQFELGEVAGRMVLEIIAGKSSGDITPLKGVPTHISINREVAKKLNITIDSHLLEQSDQQNKIREDRKIELFTCN